MLQTPLNTHFVNFIWDKSAYGTVYLAICSCSRLLAWFSRAMWILWAYNNTTVQEGLVGLPIWHPMEPNNSHSFLLGSHCMYVHGNEQQMNACPSRKHSSIIAPYVSTHACTLAVEWTNLLRSDLHYRYIYRLSPDSKSTLHDQLPHFPIIILNF